MDRRRFVPSSEGLESRQLLSTVVQATRPAAVPAATATASATAVPQVSTSGLPESYTQKLQRIENLPYFLEQLQPGRFLPADTIESIQANLVEVTAKLQGPPPATLDSFNVELRETIAEASISAQNARALNNAFGKVLVGAGASDAQVSRFAEDMNRLAQVDSQSPNPTYLASNDFAIILQTALAVGRPIQTPTPFRLSPSDGQLVGNGAGGLTTVSTPTLIGSYPAGASDDAFTRIEIVDENGDVLGSAPVDQDGRYSAQVARPLAEGQYRLNARAVDAVGNQSKLSPVFILKVVSRPTRATAAPQFLRPPGGPRSLR